MRLLRIEKPVAAPDGSRNSSNTENGRRSSGSNPGLAFTITNWPGMAMLAISGAASASTL